MNSLAAGLNYSGPRPFTLFSSLRDYYFSICRKAKPSVLLWPTRYNTHGDLRRYHALLALCANNQSICGNPSTALGHRRFLSTTPTTLSVATSSQSQRYRTGNRRFGTDEFQDNGEGSNSETLGRTWDVTALKKEVQRLILRCQKKIGKANQRISRSRDVAEESDHEKTNSTLQNIGNVEDVEMRAGEVEDLRRRLEHLRKLELSLQGIKKKKDAVLSHEIATLAIDLGVDDKPRPVPRRGEAKKKGPRSRAPSRLPYRRYYSFGNIEIRVGKRAEDNDELSLSPEHHDGRDWWMHASGCPGSHVVIRCVDETPPNDVVLDAAALAARHSKCNGQNVKVVLTRCRDIKKPRGAKPGTVQLTGRVGTVLVNMSDAAPRLQRLDSTVAVN